MKAKKTFVAEIVKIILSCVTVSLYFINIFRETAVLPGFSEHGEHITHRFNHYYSIFYKLDREGMVCLIWVAIAMIAVSITLSVVRMFYEKKALKIASYVAFGLAIVIFFILLFIAASIRYCY